jgi:signal transduction histidine kinase
MLRRSLSIVAIAVALDPAATSALPRQKQVLVLYSTRRDAQIVAVADRDLSTILQDGLAEGIDYYSEFMDSGRSGAESDRAFRDFLHLKYAGHDFDLVVAMDRIALEFLDANRGELFGEAPLVFFSDRPLTRRLANATGVTTMLNLSGTLVLATALQPDVREVFVVSGATPSDREFEAEARRQFRSFEPQLKITYLSGLSTNDLQTRLSALPRHSVVYYLIVSRDGAGENFHPLEYTDRVAAVANAPTYSWVDSVMEHGVVGGSLKSQVAEAQAIGQLALTVLRGARADTIPVSTRDLAVSQVDWRQLQRWGISEARVPAGTLVRFAEPSAWQRYRGYILGAFAVLLAQSALIAGLLVQSARRRQAEVKLLAREKELRASYDRIRDLGRRLLNAQEDERARIARELHDDLSQQMAALTIDLHLLNRADVMHAPEQDRLAAALGHAQGVARSVRDLSHRLHPSNLQLIGLVPALGTLQRDLVGTGIAVTLSHEHVPPTLRPDVTLCLFRLAQEALRNVVAHSRARHASIGLSANDGALVLTIADDGVGFDVETEYRGLGLISMSERVAQVGGTLRIRSSPDGGTRVEVTVPIEARDAKANDADDRDRSAPRSHRR